jgi:predicted kinase
VAIGGRSGSGKSSLARALAPLVGPRPGAVIVRSDELRKRLYGVAPGVRLDAGAYTPEVSRRVYDDIAARADSVLARQHAVVADAVFLRVEDRQRVEQTASDAGTPFVGIWLDAPEDTLMQRVARRGVDASDATDDVVRAQVREDAGTMAWHHVNAAQPLHRVVHDATSIVERCAKIRGS